MARRDEQLLGEIAVREGFLSLDQIEECVGLQEKEDAYRPLGALLIEKGYLEPRQLHTILEIQQQSAFQHERLERKRENDRIFSKICLSRGLVTFEQVNECLKVQTRKQKKGVFIPLSRLLLQKGHLSSEQVREVYKIQYGVVFYCAACQVSYQIPEYSQEKSYECPKCAGALVVQDTQAPVSEAEGGLEDSGYDPVLRPAKSETKLGNYRILRELGRGAMGLVYLAQDDLWKRRVALKILPGAAGLQADTVERFKREAKAAKDLDHPGIIPIYDVGEHRGTHYFAMKYVEGTSLDHLIDREGIEPQAACRMIVQAAEALEHAHAHGVIHRDIKPENLRVTPEGRVKVLDFGIAPRLHGGTLT
ncbi:MAG: serine/threonine protein kinase, partial [Planctomycetes bacterium]|nr:serine/threonine protein kinase [Planctomycetota bacterium]